jgi:hypothetical protein
MRSRTAAGALCWAILLLLVFGAAAGTTTQDLNGNNGEISRADLNKILAQHKRWLDSHGESGARAELSGVQLRGADLSGAQLNNAALASADLNGAKMNNADLSGADLGGANLRDAKLRRVHLIGADLGGAYLTGTDLTGANLAGAILRGADLKGANLASANLSRTYMDSADLADADLTGATFEPRDFPELLKLARALGLESMTYQDAPSPLTQLRKQFQDAGFREQERAITCALNRAEDNRRFSIERWARRVAFDYPSEYGFAPGRPLRIVLWLWLLSSFVYAGIMHRPGPSGIYFTGTRRWRGRSNTQGIRIRPLGFPAGRGWGLLFPWLKEEWRVFRAAMFFSLMSACNIGFREINLGGWLRMLTRREYDLKAVGWARTVSGFQSLLSVYLIGLCVLTYFSRPFG